MLRALELVSDGKYVVYSASTKIAEEYAFRMAKSIVVSVLSPADYTIKRYSIHIKSGRIEFGAASDVISYAGQNPLPIFIRDMN